MGDVGSSIFRSQPAGKVPWDISLAVNSDAEEGTQRSGGRFNSPSCGESCKPHCHVMVLFALQIGSQDRPAHDSTCLSNPKTSRSLTPRHCSRTFPAPPYRCSRPIMRLETTKRPRTEYTPVCHHRGVWRVRGGGCYIQRLSSIGGFGLGPV